LAQRLLQHQRDLEELSGPVNETLTTNESEPTTEDAITAEAQRQQEQRDEYYRQQQQAHLAPAQVEIEKLRAELAPAFEAKLKVLIADADPAVQESASIPLSADPQIAFRLMDSLALLPGGVETAAYLMRNPTEKRKLAALPEHMAQVRIAQLSNRFDPAMQRRTSQAPAPIRPITRSPTTSAVVIDETDYQTFKREREKQIKARRR
jgi:hypothetical protein